MPAHWVPMGTLEDTMKNERFMYMKMKKKTGAGGWTKRIRIADVARYVWGFTWTEYDGVSDEEKPDGGLVITGDDQVIAPPTGVRTTHDVPWAEVEQLVITTSFTEQEAEQEVDPVAKPQPRPPAQGMRIRDTPQA